VTVDIGEVDLIVNFDCLSSPIRMIQRVGRTGRKREGRVVTLVSEGQEEKTYVCDVRDSKNSGYHTMFPDTICIQVGQISTE
jgi:ERCC4-related helicase